MGSLQAAALPITAPPRPVSGAALSWARALGDFGATLLRCWQPHERNPNHAPCLFMAPLGIGCACRCCHRLGLGRRSTIGYYLLGLRLISDKKLWRGGRRELGLSFQMHLGDIDLNIDLTGDAKPIALIGPNGSGKSTLLRTMAGAYQPGIGRFKLEKGCYLIATQTYLCHPKNDAWVMSLKAMHFSHT